ncbi:MAG: hypothetical protein OEW09_18600, partial [Anaerolineae bacterium]|nr:hypothetical protein [Anaerolineae bacterium]
RTSWSWEATSVGASNRGASEHGGKAMNGRREADQALPDTVRQAAPDICFNIAEGLRGDARESQVPALPAWAAVPVGAE